MRVFITSLLLMLAPASVLTSKQEKLTNKHLVIAAEPWPPYVVLTEGVEGELRVEGLSWEYVKFWLYARNFTYTVIRSPDESFGWCSQPNNCTGIVGMVNRKEVDFALGRYYIM